MVLYWRIKACKFAGDIYNARLLLRALQLPSCWMEQHVYIFRNPFTHKDHITAYVVTADDVSPIQIHQQIKANQDKVNMNTCDCIHVDRYCEEHYNDWKTRYEEVRLEDEVLED